MTQAGCFKQKHIDLPPGCHSNPIESIFSIQLNQIQIFNLSPKPLHFKFRLWGLGSQEKIQLHRPVTFVIRTSNHLFRNYLADMKTTVFNLCDDRNQQQYGCGIINWLLFLKNAKANDLNDSPLISSSFDINLPVMSRKNKRIAQANIKVLWQKVKFKDSNLEDRENRKQSLQFQAGEINLNVDQQAKQDEKGTLKQNIGRKDFTNTKNKKSLDANQQYQFQQNRKLFNLPQTILNRCHSNQNAHKKMTTINQLSATSQKLKQAILYSECQYEKEKTQLRLEAQQLLTVTKKQQIDHRAQIESLITVRVTDLVLTKQNVDVEWIDIYIIHKQSQEVKQQDESSKHIRAFPNMKGKFKSQILVREGDQIQIELSKNSAKGLVSAKSIKQIKQKGVFKLLLYCKSAKVGSINLAQLTSSGKSKKQSIQMKKQKYDQQQENQIQKLQPSTPLFLLIKIYKYFYPGLTSCNIFVKSYPFFAPYPSTNVIPISQVGSLFAIQFRNTNSETFDSIIVTDYTKMKINQLSFSCAVVKSGILAGEKGWIDSEIMIGTISQINYQMSRENKYKKIANTSIQQKIQQNREATYQYQTAKANQDARLRKFQNKSNKYQNNGNHQVIKQTSKYGGNPPSKSNKQQSLISEGGNHEVGPNSRYRRTKKNYTQVVQERMHTDEVFEFNNNQEIQINQQLQNEAICLSQVLSRFLHALPVDKITEMPPSNIQEFLKLLNHFLAGREERQLIQIVIDMFISDVGSQEREDGRLEYDQFLKCLNSYHNFLELWWKIRVDTLTQLIKLEPEFEERIIKYSQLGTISKQNFWNKVWHKVQNPLIKVQIDKILRLSSTSPSNSAQLIQDFKQIQNYASEPPKQSSFDIIVDLGKLIKETLQSILQGSGVEAPSVVEDKVNIRVICDVMHSIGISLSYWEALMLIQELKSWYNVDLDYNQGTISGSVIEVWMKSVLSRSQVLNKNKQAQKQDYLENVDEIGQGISHPLLHPDRIKQSKQPQIKNKNSSALIPPQQLSQNPSLNLIRNISKPIQNKSMAKSQLNEQEIQNIANLLRDNDNFRMGTYISEKGNSKLLNNNSIGNNNGSENQKNQQKILNDQMFENESLSQKEVYIRQKTEAREETKYLHIRIKNVKLKSDLLFPVKLAMKVYGDKQHYFYCESLQEILKRQFAQQLMYNWHHQSKGVTVQLFNCYDKEISAKQEKNRFHGLLLTDQILAIKNDLAKIKTIIIYGDKQIIGKLSMEIIVSFQKPKISYIQSTVKLQILVSTQNSCWSQFKIQIPDTNNQKILISKDLMNQIQIPGTFYKDIVQISIDGVGACLIPLQQLYFRGQLAGDYPVVGDGGIYCGNLKIKIWNPNKIFNTKKSPLIFKQEEAQMSSQIVSDQKYLIIFDQITSFTFSRINQSFSQTCLIFNIFIKDAYNRISLFRSPFYVEHKLEKSSMLSSTRVSQFSQENYCIVENNQGLTKKSVTIEFQYNGRTIGLGHEAITLDRQQSIEKWCEVQYMGGINLQILMGIRVRVLLIPQQFSKYNCKRIYSSLSAYIQPFSTKQLLLASLISQSQFKLTKTQQRLLTQLISSKQCFNTFILVSKNQQAKLISQLTKIDACQSGRITKKLFQQILTNVLGNTRCQQIKYLVKVYKCVSQEDNKDSVCYLKILSKLKVEEKQNFSQHFCGRQHLTDKHQAISRVDSIYREIRTKYNNGGI